MDLFSVDAAFGNGDYKVNPKISMVRSTLFRGLTWEDYSEWCASQPAERKIKVIHIPFVNELFLF
jgi:hypothetical protein